MDVSSLYLALPTDGAAPEWVHLVPSGTFSGVDGRGPYTLKNPAKVIAASMANGKLPFDENHATETASIVGGPAPARGWIVELQARDDGIWGRVEWTQAGQALMADKSYRWVSPVFQHGQDGEVRQIKSAALTNNPNLIDKLKALHGALSAAERAKLKPEDFAVPGMQALPIHDAEHVKLAWDMVGRTEGLTDTERAEARRRIRARAKELGVDTSGWSAHTSEGNMDRKAICTALGIAETVDDAALLTALQDGQTALQAARQKIAELERSTVPLARVTELETALNTMRADQKRVAAVAFVDNAIKAGKPITAARDIYIAQHVADAASTEKMINALPSINAAGGGGGMRTAMNDAMDGDGLTAEDRAICAKMGNDPKKYAEFLKKKQAAEGSAA